MLRLQGFRELGRLFKLSTCIVGSHAGGAAPQCLPAAAAVVVRQDAFHTHHRVQQQPAFAANNSSSSNMQKFQPQPQQHWWQGKHLQTPTACGWCQPPQADTSEHVTAAPAATEAAAAAAAAPSAATAAAAARVVGYHQPHLQQHLCQPYNQQQSGGLLRLHVQDKQQLQQQLQPWGQWQQQRGLFGVVKHKNYQDHNKKKPKKNKIKTPSMARRRVVVGEDGTMWRMQAGRRHKRYKKSKRRLLGLKGMVPLHSAEAAKLRKLGFKRKWWFTVKA